MIRSALLFATVVGLLGCVATQAGGTDDPDQELIAEGLTAGFESIEAPIAQIVVADGLPDAASRLLTRRFGAIPFAEFDVREPYELPPRHFTVTDLRVYSDALILRGTLSKPSPDTFGCGTGFTIPLRLDASGQWQVQSLTVTVC